MKMPVKDPSKKASSRKTSDANRCAFHSREERQLLESQNLGSEIASPISGDFLTATDNNYVLGKLFTAVAQNRMPVRTAHTLAYIAQLMLFTLPSVKKEFNFSYKFEKWNDMLHNAVRLSPPPESASVPATVDEDQSQAQPSTSAGPTETSPTGS